MSSNYIFKSLSPLKRGIVTVPETANDLLIELMRDSEFEADLPAFVAGLPIEVQQQLRTSLREIQATDYRWKPFVFGPGGSVLNSEAEDSARLRWLCAELEGERWAVPTLRKGLLTKE